MKYQIKSVSETLMTVAIIFLIIAASTVLILALHQDKSKRFSVPYLLPVSFYSGLVNNFGTDKIQVMNELPYLWGVPLLSNMIRNIQRRKF